MENGGLLVCCCGSECCGDILKGCDLMIYSDREKEIIEMARKGVENSTAESCEHLLVKVLDNLTISETDLLSLKAVLHGCNTNRKLVGSHFVHNIHDSETRKEISFEKAIQNVMLLIERLEGDANENS